jgi:pyruvate/2-oxoglutarate dehydrogenase complex dihydrolipoamide dehydrogenase (E3) component
VNVAEDRTATEAELKELAKRFRGLVDIADRRYRLRVYEKCFVGSEACDALVRSEIASDLQQAETIGNMLLHTGVFHHVVREHDFKNEKLFYRFSDDEDHGSVETDEQGSAPSWHELVAGQFHRKSNANLIPRIPDYSKEIAAMGAVDIWGIEPLDEYNAKLLDNVRPRAWKNPEPSGTYNMVAIGAGVGGLVTTAGSAGVGAKVAIIEKHLLGGDCLNFGCVPSKALLSAAKVAATIREAAKFGIGIDGIPDNALPSKVAVDFGRVMQRLRSHRSYISKHDAAKRFANEMGADVFLGHATFTGPNSLEVDGKTLNFKKCCIATGGTPTIPKIPGLAEAPFDTNMTLFNLTKLPPRLGVIGTGVIGMEMAQAFQRFGSEVAVFSRSGRILPKEDPDAAKLVQKSLEKDGVMFIFDAKYKEVRHSSGNGDFPEITVVLEDGRTLTFDALLVATGRKPNVSGLGLEKAGVEFDPGKGVIVNDRLQTSVPHIYAVGDVATKYQFTHAADFMARMVIRNALFFGKAKFSSLLIPWCTFTDPEIAHVGLYERDLEERGIPHNTFTRYFKDVDRTIVEDKTEGFVRVHVKEKSDEILGATIVGDGAGNMISEITLAMQSETGLSKLANVIHPYPTAAEAIRQSADLYNKARLTPSIRKIFRGLMQIQR